MINQLISRKFLTGIMILFICFVFIQSLFFKFTDAPETQFIFSTLDQWASDTFGLQGLFVFPGIFNAYVIGSTELVASILLLIGLFTPKKIFIPIGALVSLSVISGAIFFHLFTPLGIEVMEDSGTLFIMACIIWITSLILIYMHRTNLEKLLCKK